MMYGIGHKRLFTAAILLLCIALVLTIGCARKRPSEKPPIHLNPDMDNQPKYDAQEIGEFFPDRSAMRTPVSGTVARGELRGDDISFKAKNSRGEFVEKAPVEITKQLLDHGQERYDIYCSPCHSRIGDGRGIMIERGYIPPPTFHSERIRELPDGHIYDVITHGVRNMPSYRYQISPADRWAIVVYLRALERSQNAGIQDIPVELRETVK